MTSLPSLVGGPPSPVDLKPTIAFLSLYALLLPFCLVALLSTHRRNVLQLPITASIIERIINLSFRLLQIRRGLRWGAMEEDIGLLEYQMIDLGWGWIALSQAMGPLLRSVMVNSTRPLSHLDEDQKPLRTRIRRTWSVVDALFWLANLLGMAAGLVWRVYIENWGLQNQEAKPSNSTWINILRYSSTGLGMALTICSAAGAFWAPCYLRGINKRPRYLLIGAWLVLLIVPIYRLSTFEETSTWLQFQSVFSDDSHLRDMPSVSSHSKALFYTFHIVPELVVSAFLITIDTRKIFSTGIWGDRAFSWREGWRTHRQWLVRTGDACFRKADELVKVVVGGKSWKSDSGVNGPNATPEIFKNNTSGSSLQRQSQQPAPSPSGSLQSARAAFFSTVGSVPRWHTVLRPNHVSSHAALDIGQRQGTSSLHTIQPPLHYNERPGTFSWRR